MAGRSTTWTDQRHYDFVLKHGPSLGYTSRAIWRAFSAEFGEEVAGSHHRFHQFALSVRDGRRLNLPGSPVGSIRELIVTLPWRTFVVTSDHQVPSHDEAFLERVFALGEAWNVEGHVINGDLFDFATISKFKASVYGERLGLGEELQLGGELIDAAVRRHKRALFVMGNHDQRLVVSLLEGQLAPDQAQRLLSANDRLQFTQLRFCQVDAYGAADPIRITHPNAASVIAGTVGADIARNHDSHVIVAHDHLVAIRRSHSGRWTVVHSGTCADPMKLAYAAAVDNRRPRMNQGAVIVHPSEEGRPVFRLLDPLNVDWDAEMWLAKRRSTGRRVVAQKAG